LARPDADRADPQWKETRCVRKPPAIELAGWLAVYRSRPAVERSPSASHSSNRHGARKRSFGPERRADRRKQQLRVVTLFVGGLPVGECRAPPEIDGLATRSAGDLTGTVPPRGAVPETHRTQVPGCPGKAVPARLTGTLAFSPPDLFLGTSHTHTPTAKRAGTPSLAIFASCHRPLAPPACAPCIPRRQCSSSPFLLICASAASGSPFPDDDHTRAPGKALIVGASRKPGETDDEDHHL